MLTLAEKDKEQGQETRESEDSKVKVGDLYIEWKRKTLNTQVKLCNKPHFFLHQQSNCTITQQSLSKTAHPPSPHTKISYIAQLICITALFYGGIVFFFIILAIVYASTALFYSFTALFYGVTALFYGCTELFYNNIAIIYIIKAL